MFETETGRLNQIISGLLWILRSYSSRIQLIFGWYIGHEKHIIWQCQGDVDSNAASLFVLNWLS